MNRPSLLQLPSEIQFLLLELCPHELKSTCRAFYIMYNELFYEKLIEEMGITILYSIHQALPHIIAYIKSFDYWRLETRKIVSNHYMLPEFSEKETGNRRRSSTLSLSGTYIRTLECQYIKDSWKYVYSIFKNRRLFAEHSDYHTDEPSNYVHNHVMQINKTYLLYYKKTIKLSPGIYNLSCGVIIKNALGLGTIKFQVRDHLTGNQLLSYYPPTNIKEMMPRDKFCLLNVGDFEIVYQGEESDSDSGLNLVSQFKATDKLIEIDIIMEETGLYLKSGFSICFFDLNAYQPHLLTDRVFAEKPRDFIFWYIENDRPSSTKVVNLLLKNCYKAIQRSLKEEIEVEVPLDLNSVPEEEELEVPIKRTYSITRRLREEEDRAFFIIENPTLYSQRFYSCFNEQGDLIKRVVKMKTPVENRKYNQLVCSYDDLMLERMAKDDYWKTAPLKWKMPTLFEL